MRYWLMKSEPDVFSIYDLKKSKTTWWDGVRNYQARNFMTQEMKVGDLVLFYHSNATPPGVAGLARVSQPAQPDLTAQDPQSDYFDPKATKENPRWFCVQIQFEKLFKNFLPLHDLRTVRGLEKMALLQRGQRLSVQPVTAKEFKIIEKLGEAPSSRSTK